METDPLDTIKARVHSTEMTDNPALAAACMIAGLAALEVRTAQREHASNRETVRNGTNGPGVLEITDAKLQVVEASLRIALDDVADIFVAARAAEDEALKQEGLQSLKGQAAGELVDARGGVIQPGDMAAPPVLEHE